MRPRIQSIIVQPEQSIRAVMAIIEASPRQKPEAAPAGIALVLSPDQTLMGVVTDGDIRRAILEGLSLEQPVATIMNHAPITVRAGLPSVEMLRAVTAALERRGTPDKRIDRIVVTDESNHPVDVVSFFELWRESEVGGRRVCVIGLGFVGLTLAISFADAGLDVLGIEQGEKVFQSLQQGIPHFHEKNLPTLLKKHIGQRFQLARGLSAPAADIYIIAVGTPIDETTGTVLYRDLEMATYQVASVLKVGDLVVVRSTVPVGTTRECVIPWLEERSGLKAGRDFSVSMAPERTVEGNALEELRTLPQIVGGYDARSVDLCVRLFRHIAPTIVTTSSLEAAELVKLVNNSFRDVIFGFANQLALLCDRFHLPVAQVIKAANEGYPRDRIPHPSPGVGGICLRKDPFLFAASAAKVGVSVPLSIAARELNRSLPELIADKIVRHALEQQHTLHRVSIGFLGLAFKGKPETSDTRGSTSLDVADALRRRGFSFDFHAHDPLVSEEEIRVLGMVPGSIQDVFKRADFVIMMINHHAYKSLDFAELSQGARAKYFFDGWYLYTPSQVEPHGFRYAALGREKGVV